MNHEMLVGEMLRFVARIPASADMEWAKDADYLRYYDGPRAATMLRALEPFALEKRGAFDVLDFGYCHGLIAEFMHRTYPQARFMIADHPHSPVWQNPEYLALIRSREYLELLALDIEDADQLPGQFDMIILAEIIEHIDPTTVARALGLLRKRIRDDGVLLVTTPNATALKAAVYGLAGRDAHHVPVSDSVMGYGHLHLWSHDLLCRTMAHFGWAPVQQLYFHGFEEWDVAKTNRTWGSLRWQIVTRLLYAVAELVPRWRGCMVSTWTPA